MMKKLAQVRITKGNAGQSIVETALMLPIIIILMVGVLDLGRLYYAYITIFNAAREGARYGISDPTNLDGPNGIRDHARNEATGSLVKPEDLEVSKDCSPCAAGYPINVTVTYSQFTLITSTIFGGGTITMRASTQMVIF